MLYYVYFSDAGVPKTGLAPDWEYLVTAENGTDKSGSAPTVTEIGGGWYYIDVVFGTAPWDVTTEDLVGVIDGGSSLADVDRYKAICVSLRGLGLSALVHKGQYDKSSGDLEIYATDGTTKEIKVAMTDTTDSQTRTPVTVS